MTRGYRKQSALLLETLRIAATKEVFALKGGTAINFFFHDCPRFSVDIDLCYLPMSEREQAFRDIHEKSIILIVALEFLPQDRGRQVHSYASGIAYYNDLEAPRQKLHDVLTGTRCCDNYVMQAELIFFAMPRKTRVGLEETSEEMKIRARYVVVCDNYSEKHRYRKRVFPHELFQSLEPIFLHHVS